MKAHWERLAATDFLSVEVCTLKGLVTFYILFFIDLASREVRIAGITPHPEAAWMMQMAWNMADVQNGFPQRTRLLILDRDTKYTEAFRQFLVREGIEVIRLPPRSSNLNAFAERFVRSIKEECVSKRIPIGTAMLRRSLHGYVAHYHLERNHQGLGNQLLVPRVTPRSITSQIVRRPRLGGLLNFYERAAA